MNKQINFQERQLIELWRTHDQSVRQIARQLTRSPSSISDELKRNSDGGGTYHAIAAQSKSETKDSPQQKH